MLGQVVINNQRVPAVFHKPLGHRAAGIGGDILHGRGVAGRGADNDGVLHSARAAQLFDDLGDAGSLLPDGDIHAGNVLARLIEDSIHRHRGFARLAVADDQLALAAPDGHHGVDGHQAGFHGL